MSTDITNERGKMLTQCTKLQPLSGVTAARCTFCWRADIEGPTEMKENYRTFVVLNLFTAETAKANTLSSEFSTVLPFVATKTE